LRAAELRAQSNTVNERAFQARINEQKFV